MVAYAHTGVPQSTQTAFRTTPAYIRVRTEQIYAGAHLNFQIHLRLPMPKKHASSFVYAPHSIKLFFVFSFPKNKNENAKNMVQVISLFPFSTASTVCLVTPTSVASFSCDQPHAVLKLFKFFVRHCVNLCFSFFPNTHSLFIRITSHPTANNRHKTIRFSFLFLNTLRNAKWCSFHYFKYPLAFKLSAESLILSNGSPGQTSSSTT